MRFLWRVYFWIFVVVMLVVRLYEGFPTVWNTIDLALTIAAGVGLFLYAYERVLFNAGFWKIFGLLFIVYKVILNALPFPVSWEPSYEPWIYLFSYPLFAVIILYSFNFTKIAARRKERSAGSAPPPDIETRSGPTAQPQPEKLFSSIWRRHQMTGIVLAIFLGPLAWLYTYRRDAWKAAIGAAVVANLWINSISSSFYYFRTEWFEGAPLTEIFTNIVAYALLIFLLPLWVWCIVNMFQAKQWQMFTPETRRQTVSIILAVLMGPWTWLYTYRKDKWKFWLSIMVIFGITFYTGAIEGAGSARILGTMTAVDILRLVVPAIYVAAILLAALRNRQWYERFGEPDSEGYSTATSFPST